MPINVGPTLIIAVKHGSTNITKVYSGADLIADFSAGPFIPELIDFGDANSSRYYTLPHHPDLDLPDSDWCWGAVTRVEENSGTAFQYLLSTGNFEATPSFQLYLSEASEASNPNKWKAHTVDDDGTLASETSLTSSVATGADSVTRFVVIQRTGTNLEMWLCPLNGSATQVANLAASSYDAMTAPTDWNFGRRSDGNADRYYEEWAGTLFKGNVALSQANIEAIAGGVHPLTVLGAAARGYWAFSSPLTTVPDEVGSSDATRFGSGWPGEAGPATLSEDEPLPAPLDTVAVTTSNFDAVLGSGGSASPGDRITLANGSYGTRTIAVSGTQANPIQVVATNLLQPLFTSLVISGNWVIVSGVTVDRGSTNESSITLDINASNVRVTRSKITNGGRLVSFRPGRTDILVDHCEVSRSRLGAIDTPDPQTQRRITVARCWIHSLLVNAGGDPSHAFLFAGGNLQREQLVDTICRFNYVEGVPGGGIHHFSHQKVSKCCFAFNNLEGTNLFTHRFGIRGRYIGNYAPSSTLRLWDDQHWAYGNDQGNIQGPAGRSGYQDDFKNLPASVGGFHAFKRARLAGNNSPIDLGSTFGANWCTGGGHETLPDPMGAGMIKPERTFDSITYAADDPDDPDTGITIRANTGAVTTNTDACVNLPGGYVQNLDSQTGSAAPASWLTDLFAEYPWIENICPNPTSLTGGPGGSAPWSIAQALTPGDDASPSTGPLRDSPGGLP